MVVKFINNISSETMDKLEENQIIALRLYLKEHETTVRPGMLENGILSIINHPNIQDDRDKGCFCARCGKYSSVEGMGYEEDVVRWHNNVPRICHAGYDGCKGWD